MGLEMGSPVMGLLLTGFLGDGLLATGNSFSEHCDSCLLPSDNLNHYPLPDPARRPWITAALAMVLRIGIWKVDSWFSPRRTTSDAARAVETAVAIAPISQNTRQEPGLFAPINPKTE